LNLWTLEPLNRIFTAILSLFAWGSFLFVGCAPKPQILPQNKTPENVLRCALKNKIEFETLACLVDLKLKGEEAKFSGTVEFFYETPGTFAFYPRSLLGMDMFRSGGKDDSLTIYFPKDNKYYSGSFSDLEKTKFWRWRIPLKMLLDMFLGRSDLFEENAKYVGSSKDLFLYRFEDESWIKEYWIDSRSCRLKKSQLIQKEGGVVYQIEYRTFETYDQIKIPRVIKIRSISKESAQIEFLERRFNFPIPRNKLRLQIPLDAEQVGFERREQ
jgi:hypothetical protein